MIFSSTKYLVRSFNALDYMMLCRCFANRAPLVITVARCASNQAALADDDPESSHELKSKPADVLVKFLADKIRLSGPISVAEFMSTVLGAPRTGYYAQQRLRKRPILGSRGDFVTAPEFSQLMGELVGVWCEHAVREDMGHQHPWDFVELGPGSGELANDVLRVLAKLNERPDSVRCRLVEISDHFIPMQADKLLSAAEIAPVDGGKHLEARDLLNDPDESLLFGNSISNLAKDSVDLKQADSGAVTFKPNFEIDYQTKFGFPIAWYRSLDRVPAGGFSVILAHEFFDALPVHKFRRVPGSAGWREVLVDYDSDRVKSKSGFFFTLSKRETISQKAYLTPKVLRALNKSVGGASNLILPAEKLSDDQRSSVVEDIEISPRSVAIIDQIIQRITISGGCCLIVDYGHVTEPRDSFRGFREHKICDPLEAIGETDLTADVDFGYLKAMIGDRALVYGPICQTMFLKNMGLDCRMNVLFENAKNDSEREYLKRCYDLLTGDREMGERFKVMAIFPKVMEPYFAKRAPVGFPKLCD